MPAKRTRPKKDEDSSRSKKSEVTAVKPPSKKRKGQQEEEDVPSPKVSVDKEPQQSQTDNSKKTKGRAKTVASSKRTRQLLPVDNDITNKKDKRKIADTEKKKGPKVDTKARSGRTNSRRKDVEMVVMEKTIDHFSHSKVQGNVLVMGQGDCGQLGLGETITERKKPYLVTGELDKKKVVQVVCGGMHTTALTDDGKVYTWGCNDEGSLGYSMSVSEVYSPNLVKAIEHHRVVQISAGDCHTVALIDNGNVYCWGVFRDSNGPFGMVDTSPTAEPKLVYSNSYNVAVKVTSGDNHVIILTEKGDIYTFGSGEQGQLGRVGGQFCTRGGRQGLGLFFNPQPIRVVRVRNAKPPVFCDIFAGSYNSFAVAKDKNCVYTWGLNNYGQLGTKNNEIKYYPERVPEDWLWSWGHSQKGSIATNDTIAIAGGMHHTLVSHNGTLYAMGSQNYGRLGLGKFAKEANTPTQITTVKDIVGVACGGSCSFGLSSTGDVFSWGMGSTLQLGQSDDSDYWEPTKITGKKLEGMKVIGISSGGQHSALLVTECAEKD